MAICAVSLSRFSLSQNMFSPPVDKILTTSTIKAFYTFVNNVKNKLYDQYRHHALQAFHSKVINCEAL